MSEAGLTSRGAVVPVDLSEEMRQSYLDYAMSVIVARAIPDVCDGLKPVHRRILYAMKESGYDWNRPYRKSARIVGDVMGKYHPHGDTAIYDAMVRMAQDFSMRLCLVDGQGNFGSMDGDPAAAMRYTEARLTRSAHSLLQDIDQDTVSFQKNYDDSIEEPVVLPARFPNLLVNGAGGIAVGMATNIPPHNLGEVIDACCALLDNPDLEVDDLLALVPGPDFPTGGIIAGRSGCRDGLRTGRGSIIIRARTHTETVRKDREAIIITEIPYQVNKARLIERIAEAVNEKVVEGIADLRDESDREGVRVVVELKRDAMVDVVLNQLYHHTALQTSFGVNMLALDRGRPRLMNLLEILKAFLVFREEVVTRRTRYDLKQAREKAHLLLGLAVAVSHLDAVIDMIRTSPDAQTARTRLMARTWPADWIQPFLFLVDGLASDQAAASYTLSEAQAKAILELRLHRLTGLEREKIRQDLDEWIRQIESFLEILRCPETLKGVVRTELLEMKAAYATPRRTLIEDSSTEFDAEALIQQEDMVVTVSFNGYIKRVALSAYRAQKRGGKGRVAMTTRDEDLIQDVFVAHTHVSLLFFSSTGRVYSLKVHRLPQANPQARGKAMINLLPLEPGETIATVMPMPDDMATWEQLHIVFATAQGYVRRNALSDFTHIRSNGKTAIRLEDGDSLVRVLTCDDHHDLLLATRAGKCIRFHMSEIRQFVGRTSSGVRGIRLAPDDQVISMSVLTHVEASTQEREDYLRRANQKRRTLADSGENGLLPLSSTLAEGRYHALEQQEEFVLTVTENGFGKRTSAYEYRETGRGGTGVVNIETSARNGAVICSFPVHHDDQIVMVTSGGQLIRCPVDDIRISARQTQGVVLLRTAEGEKVVSVARVQEEDREEETA